MPLHRKGGELGLELATCEWGETKASLHLSRAVTLIAREKPLALEELGMRVNHKKVYPVYREPGLPFRRKRGRIATRSWYANDGALHE